MTKFNHVFEHMSLNQIVTRANVVRKRQEIPKFEDEGS